MPQDLTELSPAQRDFLSRYVLELSDIGTPTSKDEDAPANIPAFDTKSVAKALQLWAATEAGLEKQFSGLRSKILKRCASLGITDIQGEVDSMFDHLAELDHGITPALQKVLDSEPGADCDAARGAARSVVDQMRKALNSPFFRAVDSENGFGNMVVQGDALSVLARIRAAL